MEMTIEEKISNAVHWWTCENQLVSESCRSAIPWIFKTSDALYGSVKHLFVQDNPLNVGTYSMGGQKSMIIMLPVSPAAYFHLRGILAMTADLYRITDSLMKSGNVANAKFYLNKIKKGANKFRDIRNFFEHIDDRLINLDKHGVSGHTTTSCGITYEKEAKDCFHLVYDGLSFHFTDEQKAKERSFTFSDFIPIFEGLEGLYYEVTSHKIHKENYPSFEQFINYQTL